MQIVPFSAAPLAELAAGLPAGRQRILTVSRGEGLGDGLLTLPFLRALRATAPEAVLLHVVDDPSSSLFGALRRFTEPLLDVGLAGGGFLGPVFPRVWRLRVLPPVDFAFVLVTRWLDAAAMRPVLRARRQFGALPGYVLSDGAPAVRQRPPGKAARLLSLIEAAWGTPAPPPTLPMLTPLSTAVTAAATLLPPGRRYVGLSLGQRPDRRAWPISSGVEVARGLLARGFTPVFLVGPQELATVRELRAACPSAPLPLAVDGGALDFEAILGVATRLEAAVAKDGGLAHLLAAAGVALISLMINPHPRWNIDPFEPRKWAPFGARVTLLDGGATLRLDPFGGDLGDAGPRYPNGGSARDAAAIPPAAVLAAFDGLTRPI